MTILAASVVAILFGVGTYLLLQRTLTRIVIGLALMAHGANLLLLAAGGSGGRPPIIGDGISDYADPLPQAMALTAIVITFGVTAFMLALAFRSWVLTSDDEVEDDVEDRRIARALWIADGADEPDVEPVAEPDEPAAVSNPDENS